MKYWSKSTLLIYKYLERMTATIDKIILDTGRYSNNRNAQHNQTTYYQTGKMIEFMDRKRKMINLKVAVEDALAEISSYDRRILVLTFIDGVTSELIAQLLGISLRTFFRKKNKAFCNYVEKLEKLGYDLVFFDSEYGQEKWILSVYNETISKAINVEEENLADRFINRVMNEVSQVNISTNYYMG